MQLILVLYAAMLFLGAFFGFKAGSKISLYMGIGSGLLVLLGVYLIDTNAQFAYWLLTVISGLLSIVFLIRLIKTRAFIPSGMLLSVSILILFLNLYQVSGP